MKLFSTLFLLSIVFSILAQDTIDESVITVDRIFHDYEFSQERFGQIEWLEDGTGYTRTGKSEEFTKKYDLVKYNLKTGKKSIVIEAKNLIPEGEEEPLKIENYIWSPNHKKIMIYTNSKRVWRYKTRGDYWIYDLSAKKLSQLGKNLPESSLMFAKFSPDNNRIAYVSKHNLYVEDINTGKINQLTNDGNDDIINGTFDWVYEEEFGCRDGFRWSPDGEKIAYWKLDATGVKDFYMINNTDSLYSYIIPVEYPKTGELLSSCKVGVISSDGGETTWLKLEGDPRNNYIPRMEWAANSDEVIIQYMNRYQNTNRVMIGNASSGETKEILTETDDAWLDVVNDWKWMPDGKSFTWISESTGWKHIYLVSRDGKTKTPITKGEFDVTSIIKIDEKRGYVYYEASPENAAQRYLYRVKMDGKALSEKLSPDNAPGTHKYDISADSKYAIHKFSTFDTPAVTDIVQLPNHKSIRTLVSNDELNEKLSKLKISKGEFFVVKTEEVEMDAYMIKPHDFDETNKYPVLFFVYSEPAGQRVLDRWMGNRYIWHQMLAQKGYVIVCVDNRGTPAPKGREWRKSIYLKMGVLNSYDQAMAAKEIIKKSFIDEKRVAIWGWSGGGSATLNAMFRYPEIYKTGMAVAPVPDIRLYDAIYQERYCGLPQEKEKEYIESSPITYAENLEGNLLVIHGTGDDNVHYQGTEKLINELIKHNKQFTMFAYPNRSHGIYEGENTSRHLFNLLTNYLLQNVKQGGEKNLHFYFDE